MESIRTASGMQSANKLIAAQPAILQLARFVAIGALNTALDFLLLNLMAAVTGIGAGGKLGIINLISFSVAILHSYAWNRAWTFGDAKDAVTLGKTLTRAFVLCVLATVTLGFAIFGAKFGFSVSVFLAALCVFAIFEVVFWKLFGIKLSTDKGPSAEFGKFLGVSLIGLVINSGTLALLAVLFGPYAAVLGGAAMVRNIAKAMATGISLVWNFLGYKLLVFKR